MLKACDIHVGGFTRLDTGLWIRGLDERVSLGFCWFQGLGVLRFWSFGFRVFGNRGGVFAGSGSRVAPQELGIGSLGCRL